jgi:hypothetical protein
VEVERAAVTQELHQRGGRERAALGGRAQRREVVLALDEDVERGRETRPGGRRRGAADADGRAGKPRERRGSRFDPRQGRVSREVDDEDRRARERRVGLERERRAERCQGLGEREGRGAYPVPSPSSLRSTRRRSFPVSL